MEPGTTPQTEDCANKFRDKIHTKTTATHDGCNEIANSLARGSFHCDDIKTHSS